MRRSLVTIENEERRELSLAEANISIRSDGDKGDTFVGHAAVFDTRTAIGNPLTWGFYEEIAPGAFTKTLSEGDARMLIDHDSYYVCSRVSAGTLNLAQDKRGLAVDSELDDELSYVKDLKSNLRNGNITGMSFGFYVVKNDWFTEEVETSDGHTAEIEIRRITEVRLIEVSAVTFPAYEETDAGLRALRSNGSPEAIARMAKYRPDLAKRLVDLGQDSHESDAEKVTYNFDAPEPDESTQDRDNSDDTTTEPDDSTQLYVPSIDARTNALKARFKRLALLK